MTRSSQPRSPGTKQSSSKRSASKKSKSTASESGIDQEQRRQMIAETAYFIAEARGFNGECQLDDWLQAEAMIDRQMSGRQPS